MANENETIEDILAELRERGECRECSPVVYDYADRIEVAHKREVQNALDAGGFVEASRKNKQVGDAAKLREFARLVSHMNDDGYWNGLASICALVGKAKAALAAPPRNCDIGTPEEQAQRFLRFCLGHQPKEGDCTCACPAFVGKDVDCHFSWAQMPYESEAEK